jgi:hypothetical protein
MNYWQARTYIDIQTGEKLTANFYKKHYKTIKKEEDITVKNNITLTTTTLIGERKTAEQLTIKF